MAQASAVVDVLKRELKARNLTYSVIAQRIGMSEASVKRMFSRSNGSTRSVKPPASSSPS